VSGFPPRKTIGGRVYVPTVFVIRTKNEDGSPGLVEHVREDDRVQLSEEAETEVLVAYCPRDMVRRS